MYKLYSNYEIVHIVKHTCFGMEIVVTDGIRLKQIKNIKGVLCNGVKR